MGRNLTRRLRGFAAVSAALAVAFPSLALAQTPPAVHRQDPTALSGVTVTAHLDLSGLDVNGRRLCELERPPGEKPARPRVVDSYPKPGAVVPAGVIYMRVTYSERMSPCGFLLADALLTPAPTFLSEPARLTRDYKSFYFAVTTEPGKSYAILFNHHFGTAFFKSLYGVGAPAFELKFATSATAAPSTTMAQAMAADPATPDLAPEPDRLIALWTPREGDDGPDCGRCEKGALASTAPAQPKNLDEARGETAPRP